MSCDHRHVTDSDARCTHCGITAEGVVFSLHDRIRARDEQLRELALLYAELEAHHKAHHDAEEALRSAYADGGNKVTRELQNAIDGLGDYKVPIDGEPVCSVCGVPAGLHDDEGGHPFASDEPEAGP